MTEEQAKKVVYGFLDGSIPYKEFVSEYHLHKEIVVWLQKMLDQCIEEGIEITYNIADIGYFGESQNRFNSEIFRNEKTGEEHTVEEYIRRWAERSAVILYDCVFCIVYSIDPSIKFYCKYRDMFHFFLANVPEYVQSIDVQEFIEKEIIEKLPKDISKTKLSKLCRQRIREEFGIEGNKYPHWVQSSEWPLGSDGRPAKYITKTNERGSDLVKFHFVDGGTGEEIIVEQSY